MERGNDGLLVDLSPAGREMFVLRDILHLHIGAKQSIKEFAFLFLC